MAVFWLPSYLEKYEEKSKKLLNELTEKLGNEEKLQEESNQSLNEEQQTTDLIENNEETKKGN